MATCLGPDMWRKQGTISRLEYALKEGHLLDCTFLVGIPGTKKQEIRGHKLILSLASPVFEAMFYRGFADEENKPIRIDDVEPQNFRKLLMYIYTDAVTHDNVESSLGLWYAANKYFIHNLSWECSKFVRENLSASNACRILEFARLFRDDELEYLVIEYIRKNTRAILDDEQFLEADQDTLVSIFLQNELNISTELELFAASLRWAECLSRKQDKSVREILKPVLGLIRFRTLTCSEFANTVCKSKILDPLEERDILLCLASDADMPQGFSNIIESRIRLPKNERQKISLPLIVNNHTSENFSLVSIEVSNEMELLGIEYNLQNSSFRSPSSASLLSASIYQNLSRPSYVDYGFAQKANIFNPPMYDIYSQPMRQTEHNSRLTVQDDNGTTYSENKIDNSVTTGFCDFTPHICLLPGRKYNIKLEIEQDNTGRPKIFPECQYMSSYNKHVGRKITHGIGNPSLHERVTENNHYTINGNIINISLSGTHIKAIYIAEYR